MHPHFFLNKLEKARHFLSKKTLYTTGEWIAFVDSDDCISKDYVETFEKYLNEDFDFFCGDEVGHRGQKEINIELIERKQFALYEKGLLNKYAIVGGPHLTSACGKLYRASFLKENGVLFPVCLFFSFFIIIWIIPMAKISRHTIKKMKNYSYLVIRIHLRKDSFMLQELFQ